MPKKPKLQPTRPGDIQYALLLAQRPRTPFLHSELYVQLRDIGIDDPGKLIRAARSHGLLYSANRDQSGPEQLRFNDRALGTYPAPPYFEELRMRAPKAEPLPPPPPAPGQRAPIYFQPIWSGPPHPRVATRVGYLRQETGKIYPVTLGRLYGYITGPDSSELASFTRAARRLAGQPYYESMIQHQDSLAVGGAWSAEPDGATREGMVLLRLQLSASLTRSQAQQVLLADLHLRDALLLLYASPDEQQLTLVLDAVEVDHATAWQQHADYFNGRYDELGLRCVPPTNSLGPEEMVFVWYDPQAYLHPALKPTPKPDEPVAAPTAETPPAGSAIA